MQKDEASLFDGVDSSVTALAKFVTGRVPRDLTEGLTVISNATQAAQKAFDSVNDEATLKPLLDGLFAVRALRRELRAMTIDEAPKYEIDFRLRQKEGEFQQAAILAKGVKIEVLANDGVVVPGQAVKVDVIVAHRGTGEVAIKRVKFNGFDLRAQQAAVRDGRVHGGGFGFPGGGRCGRGSATRRRGADAKRGKEPGRALRTHADHSSRPRASASRTGIARGRLAAIPSTPTRRSACRCGRRRSTFR